MDAGFDTSHPLPVPPCGHKAFAEACRLCYQNRYNREYREMFAMTMGRKGHKDDKARAKGVRSPKPRVAKGVRQRRT